MHYNQPNFMFSLLLLSHQDKMSGVVAFEGDLNAIVKEVIYQHIEIIVMYLVGRINTV